MSEKKPRLHQSHLSLMYSCPKAYEYRYVMGIKGPPSGVLVTGSATHKSAEENLRHKMSNGELLAEDEVCDISRDEANRIIGEEGLQPGADDEGSIETVSGKIVDQAIQLSILHHQEVAPNITPISVERTFVLELEGFPVDLAGTMDIEEVNKVRDIKTYKKSPTQNFVDTSLQLSMYGLAKKTIDGMNPEELWLDVLVKTKEPKLKQFCTTRTDADYASLLKRVDLACKQIESGLFQPCSPDNWMCSQSYCPYWQEICEFGRRARVMG